MSELIQFKSQALGHKPSMSAADPELIVGLARAELVGDQRDAALIALAATPGGALAWRMAQASSAPAQALAEALARTDAATVQRAVRPSHSGHWLVWAMAASLGMVAVGGALFEGQSQWLAKQRVAQPPAVAQQDDLIFAASSERVVSTNPSQAVDEAVFVDAFDG